MILYIGRKIRAQDRRRAVAEKPTAAFVLSLIGGIFILLGGLLWIAIGSFIGALGFGDFGLGPALLGAIGVIFALIIIIGGVMMYMKPQQHVMWGVIVLVLTIVSVPFSFIGLIIGFILGLVGGILGIVFHPSAPMAAPYAPPMAPPPQ
jgi:hypothetical protein